LKEKAKLEERDNKLDELFQQWDNDASGFVNMKFIDCTLSLYKPTPLSDIVAQGN